MAPREAKKAGVWGAVGAAEIEKTKRRGRYRRRAAPGGCISNVGEGLGCDEYITQRHGKFRQIESGEGSEIGA